MKNIAFIGQDDDDISEETLFSLDKVLRVMIRLGAENFYCSGSTDWDKYCIGMVERLREDYPYLKLDIVLPPRGDDMQLLYSGDCCVCYLGGTAEERCKKIMLLAESRSIPIINLYNFVEHYYIPDKYTI